jgi:predicted helicase
MNQSKGIIYIRNNIWYETENVVKLGITSSAKDRNNTYITGEVKSGYYMLVIKIPIEKMRLLDKLLKQYFTPYHIYKGGGTEFYDRSIINLIEPYLRKLNIIFRVLTKDEIDKMERIERLISKIKQIFNQINFKKIENKLAPNNQQQYILENIENFYNSYNIGKLIWACGLGKALLSVLMVKLLKFKSVVFGVPSNNLQIQIKNEILKIFPNKNNILFINGNKEDGIKHATNKEQIKTFLDNDTETKFIISTYHSCYLLVDEMFSFDFKIGDESHHLVGLEKEEEKGFRLFHKISSNKSLFMTATEKIINSKYSMNDESIFGKYIDVKSVHWAIENKKITDYNILVVKNTENEVDEIINVLEIDIENKDVFISCYMCLKSFEMYKDLTHILLYTNTIEDAKLAENYIDKILELNIISISKDNIYNNALYSGNCNNLRTEVDKFKNANYGIISCVYIFGEGFDLPKLNGVCIAGNMQSETRIVQYLLRPNRLEFNNPTKKAYVIIPYIDTNNWKTENKSYEKVRNIVSQMRNVDENIKQKIIILIKTNENSKENKDKKIYGNYNFEENSNELNKIILRLRYSKALDSTFSEEQDEYNYVKSINSTLNIQSKKEYLEKKMMHSNYIDHPEEYFKLKGVWNDWYDFMNVDITKFIQSKQEWINCCKEIKITSLNDYNSSCEIYDFLPKEPADYYNNFTNILSELNLTKERRRI